MPSIFTKIVNGDIPCFKIAENDEFLAFLDISPLQKGHSLVIPKLEIDYIFDIEDELYNRYFLFAKKVAVSIKAKISCARIGVVVMGLEVPHAHIHLIPIDSMDDMNFANQKLEVESTEMQIIADEISAHFDSFSG